MRNDDAHPGRGTVLTVFGARGGIGKSTIATNLAATIATSAPVLLIDMDTRFGDVALMLNIEPKFTIADLAEHADDLTDELFRQALVQHPSGAFVLAAPGAPTAGARITAEQIQRVVRFATRQFEYVVLDTPGVFNDIVATAIETADDVLVVCGLDMASVKHTAQMFDLLEPNFPSERLLLVLNQVARARTVRPNDVQRIIGRAPFWTIPYDEAVPVSQSVGELVVATSPKSAAGKQLRGLALKVAGQEEVQGPGGTGLMGRIHRWRHSGRNAA
jgi:pilus assembly protein CpaE